MVSTRGKKIDFTKLEEHSSEEEDPLQSTSAPRPKKRKLKKGADDANDAAFKEKKPRAKKSAAAATSGRKSSGRSTAGKLEGLMQMPVDIFAEICQYLHPVDLLHLARSSKRLRAILMTREAKPLWKTAMKMLGKFPECPSDLSEPQLLSLMLENGCMGCEAQTRKTNYRMRSRCCQKCFPNFFMTSYDFQKLYPSVPVTILTALPRASAYELIPTPKRRHRGYVYIPKSICIQAAKQYLALASLDGEPVVMDVDLITKNFHELSSMMADTGLEMDSWKNDEAYHKRQESNDALLNRRQSIETKLLELGWVKGDFPVYSDEWHHLVWKPVELTDRMWKTLYPKLVPLLEEQKEHRLSSEKESRKLQRRHDLVDFLQSYALDQSHKNPNDEDSGHWTDPDWMICPGELFEIPSVAALLETDVPTITQEMWEGVLDNVNKADEDIKERLHHQLLQLLEARQSSSTKTSEGQGKGKGKEVLPPVARSDLYLATTVFTCTKCEPKPSSMLWYSTLLSHEHCRTTNYLTGVRDLTCVQLADEETRALAGRLAAEVALIEDEDVHEGEVTYDQAQEVGKRWWCTRCDERNAFQETFSGLVKHHLKEQAWFKRAMDAQLQDPAGAYPGHNPDDPLPALHDTHSVESEEKLGRILTLEEILGKKQANAPAAPDPTAPPFVSSVDEDFEDSDSGMYSDEMFDDEEEYDEYGYPIDWDDELGSPSVPGMRTCLLCPRTLPADPMSLTRLEIHIRERHLKDPEIEKDSQMYIPPRPTSLLDAMDFLYGWFM